VLAISAAVREGVPEAMQAVRFLLQASGSEDAK
jgi:hypothetical protein